MILFIRKIKQAESVNAYQIEVNPGEDSQKYQAVYESRDLAADLLENGWRYGGERWLIPDEHIYINDDVQDFPSAFFERDAVSFA